MSTIDVKYAKEFRNAERLVQISEEMKRIANQKMDSAKCIASSGWKGASADLFNNALNNVQEKMIQNANSLYDAAQRYKRDIERMRKADEEARQIAERRTFS